MLAVLASLLAPLPDLERSPEDAWRLLGLLLGLVPLLGLAYSTTAAAWAHCRS